MKLGEGGRGRFVLVEVFFLPAKLTKEAGMSHTKTWVRVMMSVSRLVT